MSKVQKRGVFGNIPRGAALKAPNLGGGGWRVLVRYFV